MLCVIAKLDEEATQMLISLQKVAVPDPARRRALHGHITLAAYTGDDEAGFIRDCKELLAEHSSFTVMYEKTEILEETSILVAVPGKSSQLDTVHQNITNRYSDALDEWTRREKWVPHTTLFFSPGPELYEAYRRAAGQFVPFQARLCSIEFSRVLATGYEIVNRLNLCDP